MNVLAPDTVLAGKYVIRGPLESGGMGDVYDAWQNDLARPVAIKLLRGGLASDSSMFQRFRREAESAASLGHPNIVQVLDFRNEPPEPPMLIMEKLEGRSLRALLNEERTLTPARAAFIGLQILSALAAAHDANLVHRDMKPANVFILSTFAVRDFVKVLDFGVAKLLGPAGAAPLTDLGHVVGTASYMAPEQAKGLTVDGRADLFAVGCILFEAITGQRPRELGPSGIIDAGTKPCAKLQDASPNTDPLLAAVIDRALSLDRTARFPTAKAMASALAPFAPQELIDVGHAAGEATVRDPQPLPSRPDEHAGQPAEPTSSESAAAFARAISTTEMAPIPRTRPSGAGSQPPTAPLPLARPVAPAAPRASYPGSNPLPQQALPAPRRHGAMAVPTPAAKAWSSWLYAIPVVVVLVFVMVVCSVLLLGARTRSKERELLANTLPTRCPAPATCTGRTVAAGDTFASCAPPSANHYRSGDVVFIGSAKSAHPATFMELAPDGRARVTGATGLVRDVEQQELRGAYCLP